MSKRTSNKKAKQMICNILDKKHDIKHPFGHYFDPELKVSFFNGWGPDGYYDDWELVGCGEVSLTAEYMKGIK